MEACPGASRVYNPRSMRLRFASLLISLSLVGCAASGDSRGSRLPSGDRAAAAGLEVSDDAFPAAVRDLLASEPRSQERMTRLAGVEARQMARAANRFKGHAPQRALATVIGGLELVRMGELKPQMFGPGGRDALRGAAKELAARGDEGRARAVYDIWLAIATDAEKPEIQAHLDALSAWIKGAVARGGPVQAAGALENAAVARRLLEPSQQALDEASILTIDWIDKAFALRAAADKQRRAPPREEGAEALRALQTGGTVLAALYLRDADAKGAVAAIDKAQARDLVRPELLHALEVAADKPDAQRWMDVLHGLRPPREARGDDDGAEDQDLMRAASFAVAMEAYRLDPTVIEAAGAVAAALSDFGMADASPLVLVDAVKAHPDPRVVSGALSIAMHAMATEIEADEPEGARRAFKSSAPLLAQADDKAFAGKLQPSSAKVRALMGEIELREGRLDEARALLTQSMKSEKSGAVLLSLARIERHDGHMPAALAYLSDAVTAPDATRDPALRGEILLETSDMTREQGDVSRARTPLNEALKELAKARNTPDSEDRARVERVLSRVLDRFGAAQPAQRALDRAFEAAPRDKHQAAATVGQLVGRAFVRGDLKGARDGLARGISAELESEDLIYYALWVKLLERQLRAPTDGVADRIFSSVLDDGRWAGRLAAFGAGVLKADDLVASAKTPAQKTEALFYAAMDRRASGDSKGADDGLKQVLGASGIDLMEVAIAREILVGRGAQIGGPLPAEFAQP
jgi:tetratricopeptide (TPR) repeat protein